MIVIIINSEIARGSLELIDRIDLDNELKEHILFVCKLEYTDKPRLVFELIDDFIDINKNPSIVKKYEIDLDKFKMLVLSILEGL
jgi:hypothetical protein